MIRDRNRIYDGWTQLEGGVDAGRAPMLIDPNQVESAENMTFRGGRPVPRPGFRQLTETITNPLHGYDTDGVEYIPGYVVPTQLTAAYSYKNDVFQSAIAYNPHKGEDCIMALIGGRLFKIIPMVNSAKVTEVTVLDRSSPYVRFPLPPAPPPTGQDIIIYPPPPNDNWGSSQGIPTVNSHVNGTTVGATVEATEPGHATIVNTVWYRWSTPITGADFPIYFYINQPDWSLEAFQGSGVGSLTQIGTTAVSPNQLTFLALHNNVYYIRVRPPTHDRQAAFTLWWSASTPVIPPQTKHVPYRNNRYRPIAYMVQADKYMVAQDGYNKAIIYDGKTARRSYLEGEPNTLEVPTGTMMAYGMGRLCVIVNDRDVAFGDLYGSHLDKQTDPSDSIILFTERTFLAGGFDAAIPFNQGVATGIQFFPQLDTSTGNGQLLVFAERGAASFNLAIDRVLWQTSQFQIIALLTTGMRGHRSIVGANEDLWFRGDDGYRSFRQARSDSWGWAHIPLSTNVGQFVDADDKELLQFASSIYFDNRIIGTCSPVWNTHRLTPNPDPQPAIYGKIYHNGLVVVDFDILSSFGTKYKPTWEGHWTIGNQFRYNLPNIKIAQLLTGTFNGVTRAFAFGLVESIDLNGMTTHENQLYEVSLDDREDFDGDINWEMVMRAFDFRGGQQQTTQFTENELYDGDVWISEIAQGGIAAQPPMGACCINGNCVFTTQADCLQRGGTYLGDDTPCTPNPCQPT